jgi:hypothetical protein
MILCHINVAHYNILCDRGPKKTTRPPHLYSAQRRNKTKLLCILATTDILTYLECSLPITELEEKLGLDDSLNFAAESL